MKIIKLFFSFIGKSISYLTKNFKGILLALLIIYLIVPSNEKVNPANVVRIDLTGEISNVQEIIKSIENAREDKRILGVLFVVNSPGGAVAPSIEISHAIKRLAMLKPVVTYAQGTIASGSYYATIWSNIIIANPGSLVGSIGVIFQGFNLQKIMEKIGLSTQIVKAGKFKEVGTLTRSWSDYEKKELLTVTQDIYKLFISDVAKARKLNIEDQDKFANAHIFTALKAKEVGLIDKVATIYEAKLILKKLAKINKMIWKKATFMETFTKRLSSQIIKSINTSFLQLTLK